jgi:hypothetical protein
MLTYTPASLLQASLLTEVREARASLTRGDIEFGPFRRFRNRRTDHVDSG